MLTGHFEVFKILGLGKLETRTHSGRVFLKIWTLNSVDASASKRLSAFKMFSFLEIETFGRFSWIPNQAGPVQAWSGTISKESSLFREQETLTPGDPGPRSLFLTLTRFAFAREKPFSPDSYSLCCALGFSYY